MDGTDVVMAVLGYWCADCGNHFAIHIAPEELSASLAPDRTDTCPECGQFVARGLVTCPGCWYCFALYLPHWHVLCGLADAACPACGRSHLSACIC